jgi:adenylate cyclase
MWNGGMRYLFEAYSVDTDRRELRRGASLVPVEPKVFDLLVYLLANREHVVTKDDLLTAVWNGRIVSESALTTRINAARTALGDSGEEQRLIKTLPRKGLRFVGTVREEASSGNAAVDAPEVPRAALALPDKPSIAVLPFSNLSTDREHEYFADGIVEDIITELSRFGELFVIARNSSFQYKNKGVDVREIGRELGVRYVLEGSVRRSGDNLRISAQLIDAATGVHRWAERYDRKLADVFAVQDDVVRTIVAILAAHVRKAEIERTRAKPPGSWQAYDCYLQALEALLSFTSSLGVEDLYATRRLLERSLAVDPTYARSWAMLANTHSATWSMPLDSDFLNPDGLEKAHQFGRTAVRLDANLPEAHAGLGLALLFKREYDASIAAFERAIALNPNFVNWPFGFALVYAGDPRRAVDVIEAYMRLDPFYQPLASGFLGFAHYMLKQYAQALPLLRDCASRSPTFRSSRVWLAATYAQLGRIDEARAEAAEILRIQPDLAIGGFTISGTVKRIMEFRHAEDDRHFLDGLRKAGLPE